MIPAPAVPRLWPNRTGVCAASGPSLIPADVLLAARYPLIAVNDAYQLVPASITDLVLFAADRKWWRWHPDACVRPARAKYTLQATSGQSWLSGVVTLARTGVEGLDDHPTGVRTGGHSGYAAINLAYHLGLTTIVLIGYDLQSAVVAGQERHHFFGEHPDGSHPRYRQWAASYAPLAAALAARGVQLINCSRQTAIPGVARMALSEVLR